MKRLVLVGGGHSHVEVLRRFAEHPEPGAELTLISPYGEAAYSGMLPGLIAGHYRHDECHIDLVSLANRAQTRFVRAAVNGLHLDAQLVFCASGEIVHYDLVSIDIGSTPDLLGVAGATLNALPVKPIETFLLRWQQIVENQQRSPEALHVLMVGGGAAGVETLLAMQHRLRASDGQHLRFSLVTDTESVLPSHCVAVQRIFNRILREREVRVLRGCGVERALPGKVLCRDGRHAEADLLVWATGASAPCWPRESGIETDARGFIRINAFLQSIHRPEVFAAGDVAEMDHAPRPKSGVYAVRQGPPLAHNLRCFLRGESLVAYRPQRNALALISTGGRHAVASRGPLAIEGKWIWNWKDSIDRRFMRRYAN
jgi:selenide, water dikinase